MGDWKLTIKNDGSGAELYHLASDPYETKDLASDEPDRVAALKDRWRKFRVKDR
jgi:arylsulfatase